MVAPSNITSAIRRFITTDLAPDLDGAELEEDASLLDSGILDSFGIMSLLEFIQAEFGVDVPAEDIEPDNFETIAAIAQTVSTYLRS